ncbi:hypothetical protein [Catellatospora sichuanensis]|uniref:hypothetical protein n=1 Tax=Catellatospora sichuanensis TaxID=1969805 RepID=UPI00118355AE|nr:hypothetical protein [Catellatospora sichuanensis]
MTEQNPPAKLPRTPEAIREAVEALRVSDPEGALMLQIRAALSDGHGQRITDRAAYARAQQVDGMLRDADRGVADMANRGELSVTDADLIRLAIAEPGNRAKLAQQLAARQR